MTDTGKGFLAAAAITGTTWLSTAAVSIYAIKKTENPRWGWLMLLPACFGTVTYESTRKTKSDDGISITFDNSRAP